MSKVLDEVFVQRIQELEKQRDDAIQAKLSAFSEVERLERLVTDLETEVSSLRFQLDDAREEAAEIALGEDW
jgi:predicted  nucleic acid-binding Zn-ribbon protein